MTLDKILPNQFTGNFKRRLIGSLPFDGAWLSDNSCERITNQYTERYFYVFVYSKCFGSRLNSIRIINTINNATSRHFKWIRPFHLAATSYRQSFLRQICEKSVIGWTKFCNFIWSAYSVNTFITAMTSQVSFNSGLQVWTEKIVDFTIIVYIIFILNIASDYFNTSLCIYVRSKELFIWPLS